VHFGIGIDDRLMEILFSHLDVLAVDSFCVWRPRRLL
jgi:hypothetical protein